MLAHWNQKKTKKPLGACTDCVASRRIVPTLNGMELGAFTASQGLGADSGGGGVASFLNALMPGMTGQASGSTFTSAITAIEQGNVFQASSKAQTVLVIGGVTVVGLGILAYFMMKK